MAASIALSTAAKRALASVGVGVGIAVGVAVGAGGPGEGPRAGATGARAWHADALAPHARRSAAATASHLARIDARPCGAPT